MVTYRKNIVLLFLLMAFISKSSSCQTSDTPDDVFNILLKHQTAEVKIGQSHELMDFVNMHVLVNAQKKGLNGYRILLFSKIGQEAHRKAQAVKVDYLKKYSDRECYLDFEAPNFQVLVGDFRNKHEAMNYLLVIKEDYPDAFVVKDRINYPELLRK